MHGQSAQQTRPIKPSSGCKLSQTINGDGAGREDGRSCEDRRSRREDVAMAPFKDAGDAGTGGRCSVLLELHVVGGAHLHFSLAYILPVGAQDGAA